MQSVSSTLIGIDPGMGGGITIIQGQSIQTFDVPTKVEGKGKKAKDVYDKEGMAALLRPHAGRNTIVCLESVHAMPGQGVSSMFGFGRGFGLWEGICAAFDVNMDIVTPMKWKKTWPDRLIMPAVEKPEILKLTKQEVKKLTKTKKQEYDEAKKDYDRKKAKTKDEAKSAARLLASELYPNLSEMFKLKKHDGRAESLLMAEYKRLEILNGKV